MAQSSSSVQVSTLQKFSMKSKVIVLSVILMGLASMLAAKLSGNREPQGAVPASIYDLKIKSLDGKEIDFSQYRG